MDARINIQKKYLFFRRDAREIFKKVIEVKKTPGNVCLDFSGAAFFSRSFVDEFLNVVGELKNRRILITIQNLNPRLEKMADRIQKTKAEIQKAMVK